MFDDPEQIARHYDKDTINTFLRETELMLSHASDTPAYGKYYSDLNSLNLALAMYDNVPHDDKGELVYLKNKIREHKSRPKPIYNIYNTIKEEKDVA